MAIPSIGFCTTCRNRLWQLQQTLAENLANIGEGNTLTVVDYGSTDGLADWVWSGFRDEIGNRLQFFEVTNEVLWHVAKAKNLAHRISPGQYLFNLDADNFVAPDDLERITAAATNGLVCSQFSGNWPDGSFGRIGLPRRLFFYLGGYDEALLSMSVEDMDLLARSRRVNMQTHMLGAPVRTAVFNTFEQKMAEVGTIEEGAKELFNQQERLNQHFAKMKLRHEGPVRLGGFASYNGRLNGKPVTIDGFNTLRPLVTAQPRPGVETHHARTS